MAIESDEASCAPPDPFWNLNRAIAEWSWKRGDGATVSARIAEGVSAATDVPVARAKTGIHAVASTAFGVVLGKAIGSPFIGLAVGLGLFAYLERDRC